MIGGIDVIEADHNRSRHIVQARLDQRRKAQDKPRLQRLKTQLLSAVST
jgi:hypothetical protein